MSIGEKIKAINHKQQNKTQYDLDRQTAKISALSLVNVCKFEFLTGKDVLPEKDLLEKAVIKKRFEYSPLGQELKGQTYKETFCKETVSKIRRYFCVL